MLSIKTKEGKSALKNILIRDGFEEYYNDIYSTMLKYEKYFIDDRNNLKTYMHNKMHYGCKFNDMEFIFDAVKYQYLNSATPHQTTFLSYLFEQFVDFVEKNRKNTHFIIIKFLPTKIEYIGISLDNPNTKRKIKVIGMMS